MSAHKWGDLAEGLRACQRAGCTVLFDPILGLWKRSGTLGWEIIKRDQPIPPCTGKQLPDAQCYNPSEPAA